VTIGICLAVQLALVGAEWSGVMTGFVPSNAPLRQPEVLCLTIGIVGATVICGRRLDRRERSGQIAGREPGCTGSSIAFRQRTWLDRGKLGRSAQK
jgi:hypothetical protein